MSGDTILTLDTMEPTRDVVTIDGIGYELNTPEDFGISEQVRLSGLIRRFTALESKDDPSDADLVAIQQLYDDAVRIIVRGLPGEYLGSTKVPKKGKPKYSEGRLRFSQKQRLLTVFTRRRLQPGMTPNP